MRMKLIISGRVFLMKLPLKANRAEKMTTAPITGLYAAKGEYCCDDPLKMVSVEGAFQRVHRAETVEPKPEASIPHHGRKMLASASAPLMSEMRLIFGNFAGSVLDIVVVQTCL